MANQRAASRSELIASIRGAHAELSPQIERARMGDFTAAAEAVRRARAIAAFARVVPAPIVEVQANRLCELLQSLPPHAWTTQVDAALASLGFEVERAGRDRGSSTSIPVAMAAARVLVVDPDASSRAALEAKLREQLVTVSAFASAEQAFERARDVAPDVVFVDASLVDDNHRDASTKSVRFIDELHRIPGCANVPVAVVGEEGYAPRKASVAQGGALYVERPLGSEALGVALRRLLDLRRAVQPKVLVVDDDGDYLAALRRLLQAAGFVVQTLDDPRRILEQLDELHPDIVLCDVHMPELSGYDVCRILRTSAEWQDVPLVMLTSRADVDAQLAAFRAGADDFVPKAAPPDELITRVRGRVERTRALRERGERDVLTGLYRRGAFMSSLLSLTNHARRRGRTVGLALLDLDRFKDVNDVHGHLAGDRVLVALGQLVSSSFRAEDVCGRWGGEELVVAFPDADAESVVPAVERVLDELRAMVFAGESAEFHVSFSAGVATFPDDGQTPADLFAVADRRLYVAKKLGRARVVSSG